MGVSQETCLLSTFIYSDEMCIPSKGTFTQMMGWEKGRYLSVWDENMTFNLKSIYLDKPSATVITLKPVVVTSLSQRICVQMHS